MVKSILRYLTHYETPMNTEDLFARVEAQEFTIQELKRTRDAVTGEFINAIKHCKAILVNGNGKMPHKFIP